LSLVIAGLKDQRLSHQLSIQLSLSIMFIINQLQSSDLWLDVGFPSSYICMKMQCSDTLLVWNFNTNVTC